MRAFVSLAAIFCVLSVSCNRDDDDSDSGSSPPPLPPPPPPDPIVLLNTEFNDQTLPPEWVIDGNGVWYIRSYQGTPPPCLGLESSASFDQGLIRSANDYPSRNVTYSFNILHGTQYPSKYARFTLTNGYRPEEPRFDILIETSYGGDNVIYNWDKVVYNINGTYTTSYERESNKFRNYKIVFDDTGTVTIYRDGYFRHRVSGIPNVRFTIRLLATGTGQFFTGFLFDSIMVTMP